ncbi:hypothetical protein E3T35_00620 [Cryobacterium sp. TMT1-2-2]|uniref:hypothetical protein n=1 Tax=Cryobacterium sp. TMT1-2-2 TaxID=1259233 RepID=UPI001068FBFF|nr:hypothetical protein [Cryobacterium sp. TMT1-2-2]TFD14930.1 hypothetical protein E3T35_00620 [Cryobacterium sp. TMT1-2-2]
MTSGDPQPLSRRQARELAREQGDEAAAVYDAIPTLDVPVLVPAALRPASFAPSAQTSTSRRTSRNHTAPDPKELQDTVDKVPTPGAAEPDPSVPASHTLSRRELRALHAREDEERALNTGDLTTPSDQPADAETTAAGPVDPELVEAELIEPEPTTPVAVDPVESEQMYAEPIVAEPIEAPDPTISDKTGWMPPIGHWSVDADAPRVDVSQPDQSLDELINRGIGAGGIPTTTNALILPSIPHQPSSVSPISNTGEIMITGSFDLPRSLGSTGAHPNLFDSSEMDHLMDQLDADQLGGDSAPVSASRAVSTHASTRGMLTPPKNQRASLPTVLVIATAALAVSVLALFVTGYLLGLF